MNCTLKDCESCAFFPYHFDKLPLDRADNDVCKSDPYAIVDTFATPARAYWAADMLNDLVRS
jgi:hypothetical protein